MTEKRFKIVDKQFISYYGGTGYKISNEECGFWLWHNKNESQKVCDKLNSILDENEQLKKELKRCRDWLNSDKNDYQLTLAFIKSKGYSLKDVLEYEKELQE